MINTTDQLMVKIALPTSTIVTLTVIRLVRTMTNALLAKMDGVFTTSMDNAYHGIVGWSQEGSVPAVHQDIIRQLTGLSVADMFLDVKPTPNLRQMFQ
jgi:hypothetical protein